MSKTSWQDYFTKEILAAHKSWMETRYATSQAGRIVVEDADLRGAKLQKMVMVGAQFRRCNFAGADLSGVWLTEAECVGCSFDQACLKEAKINASQFRNCHFIGADLTSADCSASSLSDCNFQSACMEDASLVKSLLTNVDLTNAKLASAKLNKASFLKCSLQRASLYKTRGDFATFMNVDFREAKVSEFVLAGTSFSECSFYGTQGTPLVLRQYNVMRPDFSARFDGSDIANPEQLYLMWGHHDKSPYQ